jgi:predicted ATPase/class 3 adenylate cyclase
MSEELASDGPRGAEELNRVLLMTFTAMIDLIHQMGGEVSHFYGDAMSVYFPDGDGRAPHRALACAQLMQRLMLTSFQRVVTNRPSNKSPFFELTIKIGVGYGLCQELVVGQPARNLEFVLTGTAVDEAAAAEKQATAGQVIASRAVLEKAGLAATADFNLFNPEQFEQPTAVPMFDWKQVEADAYQKLAAVAPAFVHHALARRLLSSGADTLAEHRPVTSLFVQFDFADDNDPSSAIETAVMGQQLQQYYEWAGGVVARFGQENGRVNRVLTGDKGNQLHIIFGAPVAPDGPDQAIRCALALQREKPAFIARQRIGLAVGKVFAGPVGSAARQEYTVVGDVVNLSARLMQICADGQVFTDRATAERAGQWFEFESLPLVQLKGKQTAVTPHIPLSERATAAQLQAFIHRWERPLVGREEELSQIEAATSRALAGQGGVVAFSGATGVGKSRLAAATAQQWLDTGGLGLLGVAYPHTSETPYSLWRGIWQAFFGLAASMEVAAQVTAVSQRTRALVPDAGDDVGLWGEVLGLPIPQSATLAGLTAEARQARLFVLARRCFEAQARERPLLLILEGLHWADQASLSLLDDFTAYIEAVPIFLCLTFRPDANLALATLTRPICTLLAVSELQPQPARQLLEQLVGVPTLPAAVEQHLGLRDRDGRDSPVNPLFLEEAVRMMEGVGVLTRNVVTGDGRLHVNESLLSQIQVPDTIHGLLLARLDRLPVAERDLLQVASVIGRQFAAEPLGVLSAEPSPQLIVDMLANLSAAEMTRLVQADPEWIYLFQHAMTHEVAYESLPYARRQMLHALIADWLIEANAENLKPLYSLLAYHYGRAANDDKGLEYALKAANTARDIFANQEAVDLYTQAERHLKALGEEGLWETAVNLYLARGNVLMSLGDLDAAYQDTQRAMSIARSFQAHASVAESIVSMAEIRYRQGRLEEVKALTGQLFSDLETAASLEQLAKAHIWAGWASSSTLNHQAALLHLQKAETICLTGQNNYLLARVYEAQSYAYYLQKELQLSLEAMQRSVQLSRKFSTPLNLGTALSNIGFVQFMLGQYEEALDTFNEAVQIGRDSGRNLLVMALANRAATLCRTSRFPEALQDFEEAIELLKGMNYPGLQVETYLFWGFEYSSVLGNWQEARVQFGEAAKIIDRQPDSYIEERARLLIGMGQVELNEGNLEKAETLLHEAMALIETKELTGWRPVAVNLLERLSLAKG